MNYYASFFLRRKMPTSWSVWEALSFLTARRRGWTKCSYLWGSVSCHVSYHMGRYRFWPLCNLLHSVSLVSKRWDKNDFSMMRKIFFYIYNEHRMYEYLYILLSPIRKLQTRCQRCSTSTLRLCPHCTVGRLSSLYCTEPHRGYSH